MEKRYPRGMIYSTTGSGIGEDITLGDNGILYSDEGKKNTVFAPYSSIDRIKYETIPQEVLDEIARANAAKDDGQKK